MGSKDSAANDAKQIAVLAKAVAKSIRDGKAAEASWKASKGK